MLDYGQKFSTKIILIHDKLYFNGAWGLQRIEIHFLGKNIDIRYRESFMLNFKRNESQSLISYREPKASATIVKRGAWPILPMGNLLRTFTSTIVYS